MATKHTLKRGSTRPVLRYPLPGVDLTGATATFLMSARPGFPATVNAPAIIANGALEYHWQPGDTDHAVTHYGEFEVVFPGGAVETFPSDDYIRIVVKQDIGDGGSVAPPAMIVLSGALVEAGADVASGSASVGISLSGAMAEDGGDTASGSLSIVAPGAITLSAALTEAGADTASGEMTVTTLGPTIGGLAVGSDGAAGTIYSGYVLADGDDFDASPDFLTPTDHDGAYMTTRHYGVQSGAPRYLRGSASLGGYEADPWHSGFADAGRGVVPASFADTITISNGAIKLKSRRATAAEKALMGPLSSKGNLSSMVHMARRNMMRAPCIMEMRLRFPYALSSWNQWHPTFWLLQSQPGNGFDGMELDCEGFGPQLEFYKHQWTNGTAEYGPLLGRTAAVSKTEYRTYSFEIFDSAGVWKVRLWENGTLVAEADAGAWFDPSRPFHLMMTNHILQSGLDQAVFDAAGDAGADMECDWWRAWQPAGGTFRKPLVPAATLLADFNAPFSFTLPTPQEVWGPDVSSDVVEMIPNEDNSPAQPWVRGLLPTSVTRTGNTLAGTISDRPGRLVLARSATPANGDGCIPQPITVCVGPRITGLGNMSLVAGDGVDMDVYAACDCGDLHMGKQITVAGLSGSGLAYNAQTGRITGTAAQGTHSLTIAVTNAVGQTASRQITLTVAAANPNPNPQPGTPAYAAWTGPGWFDLGDTSTLTLSGSLITGVANKRSGGPALAAAGASISSVANGRNGRAVARFVRNVDNPARLSPVGEPADAISAVSQGDDRPFTVLAVYVPRGTDTGYVWSWSRTVDANNSQQVALIRRTTSTSVRRQVVEATNNDRSWSGQAADVARIVAVRHTGTQVSAWDTSLAKAVDAVAQDVAALSSQMTFLIGTSRSFGNSATGYAGPAMAMDLCEVIIEAEAKADADIQQAISDLAAKWGITLT